MRLRLALLTALVLALAPAALAGCGGGEEEAGEEAAAEPATTDTEVSPEAEGNPVAGRQVFADAGCGNCHTLADAGSTAQIGPNLDDLRPGFVRVVRQVTNGGKVMPAFGNQLSEEQIADVAAYVAQATGG